MDVADLTPQQVTDSWHIFKCDYCDWDINRRCRTASGALTKPHLNRRTKMAAWLDRQPEVDELRQAVDRGDALLTAANDALRVAELNAGELAEQLKTARAGAALVPALRDQIADLLDDKAELEKRIEELTKPQPEPEPTPTTLFGASPASPGGTSLAAQRAPFLKYGKALPVRQFFGTEVAPRAPKTEVLRLHASWNLGSMAVADLTTDWVKKVTANLLAGDEVEVIHEADKKVTDGKRTYEDCVAYKNRFYDLVTQVRPDLLVVNTLTGGTLADYGGTKEDRWGVVKAHLLGVDCDGVHDKTAPLDIPYADEMASAAAFVKKFAANGYRGIVVPEFGTSRPAYDTDGKLRAAWITTNADLFVKSGVLEVNAYEYESTAGNEFKTGSPEHAAWKALVATNQEN